MFITSVRNCNDVKFTFGIYIVYRTSKEVSHTGGKKHVLCLQTLVDCVPNEPRTPTPIHTYPPFPHTQPPPHPPPLPPPAPLALPAQRGGRHLGVADLDELGHILKVIVGDVGVGARTGVPEINKRESEDPDLGS